MNSSTEQQKPQAIDYQNLERLWGQEVNQISVPVREIIAGVLRKVREENPNKTPSHSFYYTSSVAATVYDSPII